MSRANMLVAGFCFGLSFASYAYFFLNLRNRQGPLSPRERMLLSAMIGLAIGLFAIRSVLLFRGG